MHHQNAKGHCSLPATSSCSPEVMQLSPSNLESLYVLGALLAQPETNSEPNK